MTTAPRPLRKKIGVFPRGLESLFIQSSHHEIVYLVPENTPEEAWARGFLDPQSILTYRFKNKTKSVDDLSTVSALQNSTLTAVLKKNRVDALLLPFRFTPFVEQWSKNHGIEILSTPFDLQQKFENKLWFNHFLKTHHLPRPASAVYCPAKNRTLPFKGKMVLQAADSFSSDGTFFIQSQDDIDRLLKTRKIKANQDYLIRRFARGKTYGITVFITNGLLALSSLRLQCFYPQTAKTKKVFAGVHWVPTSRVNQNVRRQLNSIFEKLGRLLYSMRFFGFANFDLVIDDDERVLFIECNPRISSATAQLIAFPEVLSGIPAGKHFVDDFFNPKPYSAHPRFYAYPNSNFQGSFLDIAVSPKTLSGQKTIHNEYPNGLYSLKSGAPQFKQPDIRSFDRQNPELIYYCEARAGERYNGAMTLGTTISNVPLYSPQGSINALGWKVIETFKV